MACPLPDVRRPAPGGGVRSSGQSPRAARSIRAATGEGKTGRANTREPLVDAWLSEIPVDGKCGGVQGLAAAKRQTPAGKWLRSGMSTVVPGAQRAPSPVAARMCGTR